MVKLDRIYTGGGDKGETSLVGGDRVAKDAARVIAMGDVDEANGVIGLARHALEQDRPELAEILARIQNDLFDLGADLATPGSDLKEGSLRIQPNQVTRLEQEIDALNDSLAPLTSFVLPGGSEPACWLHLARTVVRRAERAATSLARAEDINHHLMVYLNRLSDLIFVIARAANDNGRRDILWQPGMTAGD
ncbi:MAG: cob(I)yrinic acid a,c-diamide adenosyltransferase [Rhodospirillaceae bacterium]|jgi:cob(I)alamin adenosyltransferase|nr:cob(I)yrinic acid a,c-diamide adenosyltransferase [Rhodospirillaceae bacterium]